MIGTIITLKNGSLWNPAPSSDTVTCENCENGVDTPEAIRGES